MHNSSKGLTPGRGIRPIRVRWHADQPPMPLGCRWCGHPPYAHEAASLPHRPHHHWEQPTAAQVHARMNARRRLRLCDRPPAAVPVRPLAWPEPPTSMPVRPFPRPESPAVFPGRHRRPHQPMTTAPTPYRRDRPPSTPVSSGGRDLYRNGRAI